MPTGTILVRGAGDPYLELQSSLLDEKNQTDILKAAMDMVMEQMEAQRDVEKRLEGSGISLQDIFNKRSLLKSGAQLFKWTGKHDEIFGKKGEVVDRKAEDIEATREQFQKQSKEYYDYQNKFLDTLRETCSKFSGQKITSDNLKALQNAVRKFGAENEKISEEYIKNFDDLLERAKGEKGESKVSSEAAQQAQQQITNLIHHLDIITESQTDGTVFSLSEEGGKIAVTINGDAKEIDEVQKELKEILKTIRGELRGKSAEEKKAIISRILHTRNSISGDKTVGSKVKTALKNLSDKLATISSTTDEKNEDLRKVLSKRYNIDLVEWLKAHLDIEKGVVKRITYKERIGEERSVAASQKGYATELTLDILPSDLLEGKDTQKYLYQVLDANKAVFKRQLYYKGDLSYYFSSDFDSFLDGLKNDQVSQEKTPNTSSSSSSKEAKPVSTKAVLNKVDNILNVSNEKGKFYIAFSEKFLDPGNYIGGAASHISLLGSNATVASTLDLFRSNLMGGNEVTNTLVAALANAGNSSVFSAEQRPALEKYLSKLMSAHFMQLAFNAEDFSKSLQKEMGGDSASNVLYVVQATNGYAPASRFLYSIYNTLSSADTIKDVVKTTITANDPGPGIDNPFYQEALDKYPEKEQSGMRWAYVQQQVLNSINIQVTANMNNLAYFFSL